MRRAIMAAMLLLVPAPAFAIPPDHPLTVPTVPEIPLVPTRLEMEILEQERLDRDWLQVVRTMPQYRMPPFGDYEQEFRWGTSPFAYPIPVISVFRF